MEANWRATGVAISCEEAVNRTIEIRLTSDDLPTLVEALQQSDTAAMTP